MGVNDIGIDLGTSNTLIYKKSKGVVLNEPSVIATETYSGRLLAVGREAKKMLGRTPESVTAIQPLQDGVIANFEMTATMLREYIRRTKSGFGAINAVVSIPCRATPVEKRAVEDAVYAANVRKVLVIEESLLAALGAGLSIFEPRGHMIVDIGGGTTEIAVVSLGGLVSVTSSMSGGNKFDRDIINYIKKTHSVLIGETTAEEIKQTIGSVYDDGHVDFITVSGRDMVQGLPINIALSTDDIREALSDSVQSIIDNIKMTLEAIPPEMAADIMQQGITLIGGGSLIAGWQDLIFRETGISAHFAPSPLECVAIGAGNAPDFLDQLKLGTQQEYILR